MRLADAAGTTVAEVPAPSFLGDVKF
jgi:hypothetical protein